MVASIIAYVIPLCLAFLGVGLYDMGIYRRGKSFLWNLLCIYLILVMGLRYEVGGDTLTYMLWFEWAKNLDDWNPFNIIQNYEPGFTFLAAIAKSYGKDFVYLQIIHAAILNIGIFYFISKNTTYWFFAICIAFLTYYLYFSTEVLREALAVIIFVLNFKLFQERKWGEFYLLVFICILFHYSASFLLFLPLFSRIKFNTKFVILVFIFGILCFGIKSVVFSVIERIPVIGERVAAYSKNSFVGYFWCGLRVFQFTIIPLLILFYAKKILHRNPKYEISYLFIILSGIGIIFMPIIFQRFTNYFYPIYALSLSDLICSGLKSININKKLAASFLVFIITIGYGTYFIYLDAYQMWLPYSSILNPIHYPFRTQFAYGGNG